LCYDNHPPVRKYTPKSKIYFGKENSLLERIFASILGCKASNCSQKEKRKLKAQNNL